MKIKVQNPIPAQYKELSFLDIYRCATGKDGSLHKNLTKQKDCIDRFVLLLKLHHEEFFGARCNFTVILDGFNNLKLFRTEEKDFSVKEAYEFLKNNLTSDLL